MERIQRAQTLTHGVDPFMLSKKVLELNPSHELVRELLDLVNTDPESQLAIDMAQLLFDTAALHSGFALDDPSTFARSVHRMMDLAINQGTTGDEEHTHHDEL